MEGWRGKKERSEGPRRDRCGKRRGCCQLRILFLPQTKRPHASNPPRTPTQHLFRGTVGSGSVSLLSHTTLEGQEEAGRARGEHLSAGLGRDGSRRQLWRLELPGCSMGWDHD